MKEHAFPPEAIETIHTPPYTLVLLAVSDAIKARVTGIYIGFYF